MKYRFVHLVTLLLGSLPSRERGLKYIDKGLDPIGALSLPSRERGLKFVRHQTLAGTEGSLPSRERGLKSWYHDGKRELVSRSLHGSVD